MLRKLSLKLKSLSLIYITVAIILNSLKKRVQSSVAIVCDMFNKLTNILSFQQFSLTSMRRSGFDSNLKNNNKKIY